MPTLPYFSFNLYHIIWKEREVIFVRCLISVSLQCICHAELECFCNFHDYRFTLLNNLLDKEKKSPPKILQTLSTPKELALF